MNDLSREREDSPQFETEPQFGQVIPSRVWTCAFVALGIFVVLTILLLFTRGPWWDEGLFADVAVNFRNSGHLRSSVLAPFSFDNLPAVQEYMYWQFPAYLMALGVWFKLFSVSVIAMRFFSLFWGCVFGGSWFLFVKAIAKNETLALVVASTVLLDSSCLAASSDGRMDIMCAALGVAAMAAYATLRVSHKHWAAFLAGLFGAGSLFCHPMGLVTNACLGVLLLVNRKDWRLKTTGLFLCPYFLGAMLCFLYITQAPQIFVAQARNVSGYRTGGVLFVLGNIANDFGARYLQFYFAPHSGFHKLKLFSLLFGITGALVIVANRRIRAEPLSRLLLIFTCIDYIGVAALDNLKYPYYFIYVTPLLSGAGALWLYDTWQRWNSWRWAATALFGTYLLANGAGATYYILRNDRKSEYRPMTQVVRRYLKPNDIVMGPSELGFVLGFGPPLIDDCTVGFTSGLRAKVFVMYPACRIPGYSMFIYNWSRRELATHYHQVFKKGGYEIYLRNVGI